MIVPFTTLMYVLLISNGPNTISGIDWLWLFLALLVDIANVGAAGAANRDRLPASVPGSTAPPRRSAACGKLKAHPGRLTPVPSCPRRPGI